MGPDDTARDTLGDPAQEASAWRRAREDLGSGSWLNIAAAATQRHVLAGQGDRIAMRFVGNDLAAVPMTYRELDDLSARVAGGLERAGIADGARVFGLLGRGHEFVAALLGTLRRGAVFCPLFPAFGPEPIRQRLAIADGEAIVTTSHLYQARLRDIREGLPALRHAIVVGDGPLPAAAIPWEALVAGDPRAPARTDPEDPALIHFTSGTTGTPKGAVHVHEAVVAHLATARSVLGLRDDDVFWCTADPGWVTGTSYGIVAPLAVGATSVVDSGDFDPTRWYSIIEQQRVSVLYTSPTALRMLMRAGTGLPRSHDLSSLRSVFSVGEPLNAEVVRWGERALGLPVRDTWWQTETGAIMIATAYDDDVVPGAIGHAVAGLDVALVARDPASESGDVLVDDAGRPVTVAEPGVQGEIAIRSPWPSMMRDYLGAHTRYLRAFRDGWYLSGDLATRDADGRIWFVARGDEVIKVAGHLVGPFEVESALMEHPAVAEAGVIGLPDPVTGESVKAFVVLAAGYAWSDQLRRDITGFGRQRLGAAVAPRAIEARDALPHTRSGKTMRRLLRARELGLEPGDLSTLERA